MNTEGVAYVSEQLNSKQEQWEYSELAELRVILAQHYVALENWNAAEEALRESVPYLDSQSLKSRGYFLLGQVYEELEIYETAYGVFDRVKDHYSDYRLQYLAQRKKAELARLMGRNDIAANIFNDMLRDDKNVEYLSELDFELARTEHQRGNYKRAEILYNRVLHANNVPTKPEIRARSYNGLAEIHRFGYDDYMMAAVYYDSAAQINVSRDLLPASFNATEMASSFGSYSRIKKELSREDSLLQLGLLSEEELDSVVTVLRRQRILELQEQRQERNREDRLMTVDRSGVQDQDPSGRNGFLNTNNPALQETVKRQFYQVWGERPLTDNWRVQSLMRTQIVGDQVAEIDEGTEQTILLDVEIDLSEVPFTQNEQDSVRRRISALQYELGNLMYLSMDMPDSAAYYFRKAIENPSEDRINMVSLYSLSELYESAGNAEQSLEYTKRLLQEYPNSSFARELRGENRDVGERNETERLIAEFNSIIQNDSLSITAKADSLRLLSINFSDQPRSDLILYESIQLYLKAGSEDSLYTERITAWQNYKDHSKPDSVLVDPGLSDSLFTPLPDSLHSNNGILVKSDSLGMMKDLLTLFPYQSAEFESARSTIDSFLDRYPDSPLIGKVKTIQNEISLAEFVKDSPEQPNPNNEVPVRTDHVEEEGYMNCDKLEGVLSFRSGRNEILSLIDNTQELNELSIRFRVNHRGLVDSYTLLTDEVGQETSEALDRIINKTVVFDPMIYQARSVSVVCTITISSEQ